METVRIDRFTSRVEAEFACSMLTARGLNARVSGDDAGGVHPDIPYGIGGTAIVVPREQYEEAIALLDSEDDGPRDDDDDVAPAAGRRTAHRRPGMRIFAVVAAATTLGVFWVVVGNAAGWW